MNNPSIPIKLVMARVIARKILANPEKLGVPGYVADRLITFLEPRWDAPWARDGYRGWEHSWFWKEIEERMPEILEKLRAIDLSPAMSEDTSSDQTENNGKQSPDARNFEDK